ncbi:hypothetical protein FACS1894219_09680 [Clostridia bacterium]|nr:hypothetical protein FACS1894219_09680 [Clostridia bacterium]
MERRNRTSKDVINQIIAEELENRREIRKLTDELHELEKEGEMCDTKRILEIIDELNIIDPKDTVQEDISKTYEKTIVVKAKPKFKQFIKVAAAIAVAMLSVQVVSVIAFNMNFFGNVFEWTKDMFLTLSGAEVSEGNLDTGAFGTREYTSIDELKETEGVDIVIPHHAEVDRAVYSYDSNFHGIFLFFSDDSSLVVTLNEALESENDDALHYQNNGIKFIIYEVTKQILWFYGDDSYSFTGNIAKDYQKIIDSIS